MNKIDLLDSITATICIAVFIIGMSALTFGIEADLTTSQVYWILVTMSGIIGILMHRFHIRCREKEESA